MSGKGFEAALPGGSSDANHPQAVHDAVVRLLDAAARSRESQSAAAGHRRPRDRRRFRRPRGGLARSVQGARRAVRHELLFAPALHPRRLLADQSRARAPGGRASRRARQRHPARRAESREVADQVPLQADVRAPHQRVRQPAVRRPGASRRQAVSRRGARLSERSGCGSFDGRLRSNQRGASRTS